MILKASQRGGGKQLAHHLLRTDENEHVSVHELRGFVSNDLAGALKEAQAVSRGTRCKQFLFSVSLNPPQDERVDVATFEAVINRIEEKNKLTGHPRAVVFHEKEGRRHAHAVWSRIDAETMTARNLPYFKTKLRDLSREIYLEQGWQLPKGLMNAKERDPRNFALHEWQQAKREGIHVHDLKDMMRECWAASDSRKAFARALEERGMMLARGDRRGHVAVTHEGNVLSIARYTGQKTKDVRARLGEPGDLPGIADAKAQLAREMRAAVRRHITEAKTQFQKKMAPLERERRSMTDAHRSERALLAEKQSARWAAETRTRAGRLPKGLQGLWQRVSGEYARIRSRNEYEALAGLDRDRRQRQNLIEAQLAERRTLQSQIKDVRREHASLLLKLREDKQHHAARERDAKSDLRENFGRSTSKEQSRSQNPHADRLEALRNKDRTKPVRPRSRDLDRER